MQIIWLKVAIKHWCRINSMKQLNSTKLQQKVKQIIWLLFMVRNSFRESNGTNGLFRNYSLSNTRRKISRSKTTDWISKWSSNCKYCRISSFESTTCKTWECRTSRSNYTIIWCCCRTTFQKSSSLFRYFFKSISIISVFLGITIREKISFVS